jgi:sphingolipid C9-methyltransferase
MLSVSKTAYCFTWQIWEYFLAISVIASRQGTATCFQITMVKNINSTHRIDGIASQFGLSGALKKCKVDLRAWAAKNNVTSSTELTS